MKAFRRYYLLSLSFFLVAFFSTAQDLNGYKAAGIGFNASSSANSRMPGMAMTPYAFYRDHIHMVFVGLDIYPGVVFGKVMGGQFGYRYYTEKSTNVYHFYFEGSLQFCKFGNGIGPPVPYNFLPVDSVYQAYNMLQSTSILNAFGVGVDLKVSKKLRLEITASAGYNYTKSKYSPLNPEKIDLPNLTSGGRFQPVLFGRLGAYILLYKKHSS
jgi:hypothetical protein